MSVLQKMYFLFESLMEMENQIKKLTNNNIQVARANASSSAESNIEGGESVSISRGGTVTVLS